MLEFKLNYYFNKYKDTCIIKTSKFKNEFIKKEGKFELMNELIVMIQRYQYNKYGEILPDSNITIEVLGTGRRNQKESCRNRNRFGTKEERQKRKLVLK